MKVLILCSLLGFAASCYVFSEAVIRNTKAEGCVGDVCGPHCAWEDVKILPGQVLNRAGHCEELFCADNFDIRLTPCPFDMYGEYEWIDKDKTKLYPECCGTKTQKKRVDMDFE